MTQLLLHTQLIFFTDASVSFTQATYSAVEGDGIVVLAEVILMLEENATLQRDITLRVSVSDVLSSATPGQPHAE